MNIVQYICVNDEITKYIEINCQKINKLSTLEGFDQMHTGGW